MNSQNRSNRRSASSHRRVASAANATFLFIGLICDLEKWNAKNDQDDHGDCKTASLLGYDRRPHASKDRACIGATFKGSLRALRCHTDLRHEDAERWRLPER